MLAPFVSIGYVTCRAEYQHVQELSKGARTTVSTDVSCSMGQPILTNVNTKGYMYELLHDAWGGACTTEWAMVNIRCILGPSICSLNDIRGQLTQWG